MSDNNNATARKTIKKSEIAYLRGSGKTIKEISELYGITAAEVKEAFQRFEIISKAKPKAYIIDYIDDSEEIMNKFSSNVTIEENLEIPDTEEDSGPSIIEVAEAVMESETSTNN